MSDSTSISQNILAEMQTELNREQLKQSKRLHMLCSQSIVVPCNALNAKPSAQMRLEINRDGDFVVEELRMFAIGPTDKNGNLASAVSTPTSFASGLKSAANVDIANAGLAVQISEASRNLKWTDNFVDVSVIGTPGYSGVTFEAFKLHAYMSAGNALVVDIINKDVACLDANNYAYHYLTVAMFGKKYLDMAAQ